MGLYIIEMFPQTRQCFFFFFFNAERFIFDVNCQVFIPVVASSAVGGKDQKYIYSFIQSPVCGVRELTQAEGRGFSRVEHCFWNVPETCRALWKCQESTVRQERFGLQCVMQHVETRGLYLGRRVNLYSHYSCYHFHVCEPNPSSFTEALPSFGPFPRCNWCPPPRFEAFIFCTRLAGVPLKLKMLRQHSAGLWLDIERRRGMVCDNDSFMRIISCHLKIIILISGPMATCRRFCEDVQLSRRSEREGLSGLWADD